MKAKIDEILDLLEYVKDLETVREATKKVIKSNYEKINSLFGELFQRIHSIAEKEGYVVGIHDGNVYRKLSTQLQMGILPSVNSTLGEFSLLFRLKEGEGIIHSFLSFNGSKRELKFTLYPVVKEGKKVKWEVDPYSLEASLEKNLKKYREMVG